MSLGGKVCIVTGASRGIGKGIALQLGQAGATVYITGRTLQSTEGTQGSLQETAAEIEERGGKCIPVQCDHSKDDDIQSLFDKVSREQDGQLDLLVNNVNSAVRALLDLTGVKFWDQPLSMWDTANNVGLRNHYMCTVHAAKMMVPRKRGLIVNISSIVGIKYSHYVLEGIGKEAMDRMAADCAIELRKHNVAMITLWPGGVKTEIAKEYRGRMGEGPEEIAMVDAMLDNGETPEYPGKCVVHLMADKGIMKKSGRIFMTADLGDEFGFTDIDGRQPWNLRSVGVLLSATGHTWLASLFPRWVKIPRWILAMAGNKF